MERRRSQRIVLRVPVRVYHSGKDNHPVYQETFTETVSSHGALIDMPDFLPMNSRLILTNLVTEEDIACKVVFHGTTKEGQKQIGVEFLEASPKYWRVNFPPPGEKPLKRFEPSKPRS